MIDGHGDDLWRYGRKVRANFSSNVYQRVDLSALKQHLASRLDVISNYPEPEPYTLEKAIARHLGIPDEDVLVTAGATESIYLIAHAWYGSRSAIVQPTFSEYSDACSLYEHSIINITDLFLQPNLNRFGTVWLCNPNNPDGSVTLKEGLASLTAGDPDTIFFMDQSYGFFTQEPLMDDTEAVAAGNVLQLHSMTKRYAMPGLRLGYIVGNPRLLERIRRVRMPWSVNALAVEAGLYLTEHPDTAPIDKAALLEEAQRLLGELNKIPGIDVYPTQTHFMLCELESGTAADLKDWLMERHGLLIRDASNFEGLRPGNFRIATQTREENDLLIAAIKEYMNR